jgi:hypothetical protein
MNTITHQGTRRRASFVLIFLSACCPDMRSYTPKAQRELASAYQRAGQAQEYEDQYRSQNYRGHWAPSVFFRIIVGGPESSIFGPLFDDQRDA